MLTYFSNLLLINYSYYRSQLSGEDVHVWNGELSAEEQMDGQGDGDNGSMKTYVYIA